MRSRDYDVLIATDLRHSGGTTASIAQEIEVQARMGLKTGVIHVASEYLHATTWAERIRLLIAAGLAEAVSPNRAVTSRLLVLRHPRVFEHERWSIAARADHVVMVANQLPQDGAREDPYYDAPTVIDRLKAELETDPVWAPIGPTVRDSLVAHGGPRLELTDDDWHNVINADAWQPQRRKARDARGVLGRHSRDDVKKWPESPTDLLCAYPDSADQHVRVLGGGQAVRKVLGHSPKHWEVLPFGSITPEAFLATLDLYVYFHHSGWREAFGRAVLEALAVGLPVITHPYLERLFGETCHYCEPGDAPALISELLRDPHGVPNQRGIELVRDRYDWNEHRRRLKAYLDRPLAKVSRGSSRRRRVLFMSSNGSGVGHLTRLLAIARRMPEEFEPLFLTQSSGLHAARKLGFWIDYVPPQHASGLKGRAYHEYLRARIGAALSAFQPEALVFDGTFPYAGLRQALKDFPQVQRIWCRRAMWKQTTPERVERSYQHLAEFDLVLEPGEFAVEADEGVTREQRHLVDVMEPIVLLGEDEILSREEARAELGISQDAVAGLLTLGAGNINNIDALVDTIAGTVGKRSDVHLVALQSLIAKQPLKLDRARVSAIQTYPLMRLIKAFDFCIAAPGYNSFHELLANAVPTVFIPNENTDLDNQLARAEWASERGLSLMSRDSDFEALGRALEEMLKPEVRAALRERCSKLPACGGGAQAAERIAAQTRAVPDRVAPERQKEAADAGESGRKKELQRRKKVVRRRLRSYPLRLWRGARRLPKRIYRLRKRKPALKQPVKRNDRPAKPAPPARVLLIADAASSSTAEAALVDWVSCHPCSAVVMVPPEMLPALVRSGLTAEVLVEAEAAGDPGARLLFAAYSRKKSEVLVTSYGCGPVIFWNEADTSAPRPVLSLLG